jgi:hypothetical protein
VSSKMELGSATGMRTLSRRTNAASGIDAVDGSSGRKGREKSEQCPTFVKPTRAGHRPITAMRLILNPNPHPLKNQTPEGAAPRFVPAFYVCATRPFSWKDLGPSVREENLLTTASSHAEASSPCVNFGLRL